jgi:tetratricopeptide (TPR) repeat protein
MSFFKRIFGQSDPLAALRKAVGQKRWADALAMGEALDRTALDTDAAGELDQLLESAGDGLAELNLVEGEGCLRGGDRERAAEHFTLAAAQVRSHPLARRIIQAQEAMSTVENPGFVPSASGAPGCVSKCFDSGRPVSADKDDSDDPHLDESTRLELVLSSYPSDMATACIESSEAFRKAFLLAHEGRDEEAAEIFKTIPQNERNDLYHFEFGALLARLGELSRACRELETALTLNPGHTLILETLIALETAGGKEDVARKRLESILEEGGDPAFCHGGLAALFARLGHAEKALQHGSKAIAAGNADPRILLLTASLKEKSGRLGEAEAILQRIPGGGGCSGGVAIPLAEFWLRQNKNLDKALETFKGALRQGTDQSRWAMRIAQTYVAKGWKKEGIKLLNNALADPDLDPELQKEGSVLLNALGGQIHGSP